MTVTAAFRPSSSAARQHVSPSAHGGTQRDASGKQPPMSTQENKHAQHCATSTTCPNGWVWEIADIVCVYCRCYSYTGIISTLQYYNYPTNVRISFGPNLSLHMHGFKTNLQASEQESSLYDSLL